MITEDYVSFETAKLLKEKGFDEYCSKYWTNVQDAPSCFGKGFRYKNSDNVYGSDNLYCCPTLHMTCKWLRKKYNIHVEPTPYVTTDGFFWAYKILGGIIAPNVIPLPNYCVKRLKESSGFLSCEQATEAAINYCLENLI